MLRRIQEKPASEWIDSCIENGGVVATTYQTTQQAIHDPDIKANGHVVERSDGGLQLGPLARLTKTRGTPGPEINENSELVKQWLSDPRQKTKNSGSVKPPLDGIKVVEIATIIAAPLGSSFLADMGAEVIKIEPVGGGDPFRGLLMGLGSARVNGGKRSIGLNLKSDEGKLVIVLDLIKSADVLIHNFRPGVPERLGIGYDKVSELNPSIIYLQSNGYGPDGPGALRLHSPHSRSCDGRGGVSDGRKTPSEVQDMENLRLWTKRLMRANEVNPDPNTAMVVCTSVLLGLMARKTTGEGQQIFMDMFGANAYANHDDFLNYPGKNQEALADDLMHGLESTYRLYQCDNNEWIFSSFGNRSRESTVPRNLRQGWHRLQSAFSERDGRGNRYCKTSGSIQNALSL